MRRLVTTAGSMQPDHAAGDAGPCARVLYLRCASLLWAGCPAVARPNNRLQRMRGLACFRRDESLARGPAPLTLASLGAAGSGFGAAHTARRQASARGTPGRGIRDMHHRRASDVDALRTTHVRRGCLVRAAERRALVRAPPVRTSSTTPPTPPPSTRCSGPASGLVVGRLTIGCSGCGALHILFGRRKFYAWPRTTDPCVVMPQTTQYPHSCDFLSVEA